MHKTAFNTWFGCLGFMTGDCTVQLSSEQTIALGIPMFQKSHVAGAKVFWPEHNRRVNECWTGEHRTHIVGHREHRFPSAPSLTFGNVNRYEALLAGSSRNVWISVRHSINVTFQNGAGWQLYQMRYWGFCSQINPECLSGASGFVSRTPARTLEH